MELIDSFILIVASAIAFPLLLDWHKRRVDTFRKTLPERQQIAFWRRVVSRWTLVGLPLAVLLVLVPLGLNWLAAPNADATTNLNMFGVEDFKADIASATPPGGGTSAPDYTEVIRIFNHANELYKMQHYEEAERILLQIKRGKDDYGALPKIESYVIDNDLGVIAFLIRRNQKFDASDRMLSAKRHSQLPPDKLKLVEDNIRFLDTAVNTLD